MAAHMAITVASLINIAAVQKSTKVIVALAISLPQMRLVIFPDHFKHAWNYPYRYNIRHLAKFSHLQLVFTEEGTIK